MSELWAGSDTEGDHQIYDTGVVPFIRNSERGGAGGGLKWGQSQTGPTFMMTQRPWFATYRLQVHAGFTLRDAAAVVPYLKALGVSHVYLSPVLQAAPGSTHGYDVADPTRVSDDLGGEEAWTEFQATVRAHRLGVLLDIVPNHMTTALANPWWRDVLTRGPFSERAQYFDLSPLAEDEPWKIRICTLGRRYGRVLEESEFSLDLESPEPQLAYFDHRWPLCPLSWVLLDGADADLRREAEALRAVVAPTDEDRTRYRDLEAGIRRWYQQNRDTLRETAN